MDLPTYATALAARLPGTWTAEHHQHLNADMADIISMLTLGPIRYADFRNASILTNPARPISLLVTEEQPATGHGYAIRSIALTDGHAYTRQAVAGEQLELALPADPETAAAHIERTLLPYHEQLQARHRLAILEEALQGAQRALDHWDSISDGLCDDDGWPLDEQLYGDGKVRRDATALAHLQRVLPHAAALLQDGRAAHRLLPPGQEADRTGYYLRALASTFERANQILDEWKPALQRHSRPDGTPIEPGHTAAVEERNAEIWSDIDTWLTTGPALAALLRGAAVSTEPAGRTAAAEARSPRLPAAASSLVVQVLRAEQADRNRAPRR
ncbi:hypothetical protein [Kitasatospora sp. A2-31]|uniref:hypothetical protein n=1 Tax=Kitasatospora sp. A2-31 TaxID=2916414 RepID=UPI001EEC3958|nr:hypothetical protein [Kitasatospora sp. A2-31]MCG6497045.1 hypothetical protein [Kitasatospora sp. A2-31]